MERLFLVRHGKAVPHGTPGIAEDDRPLTEEGEQHVAEVAEGLDRLGVRVDRIVTSPLPRARRTAEILAETLGLSDGPEDADALRSGQSAESVRDWLRTRPEARLMIVGHDPTFSDLLGLLIGATGDPPPFAIKKGGVAELEAAGPDRYRLKWLATPRLFRRLAD